MLTQILMMRAIVVIMGGNELIFGIILSFWMFFTGLGTFLLRKVQNIKTINIIIVFQVLLSVLPIFLILAGNYIKNVFVEPGTFPNPFFTFMMICGLLLPICLISGGQFELFARFLTKLQNKENTWLAYGLDSIGAVVGGILYTILMTLNINYILIFIIIYPFVALITLAFVRYYKSMYFFHSLLLFITGFVFIFFSDIPDKINNLQFPDQKIIAKSYTPGSDYIITEYKEQQNVYENGQFISSLQQEAWTEEIVHFSLSKSFERKNVMAIGGGTNGILRELLKYDNLNITYIELNPYLDDNMLKLVDGINNTRVEVVFKNGLRIFKETNKVYDAIIFNVSNPYTIAANRFFVKDFFDGAKSILKDNGVVSISLESTGQYLSENALKMHSILYNTLKESFSYVEIFPLSKNLFVASDTIINIDLFGFLESLNIITEYVNPYYTDLFSIEFRSNLLKDEIISDTEINTLMNPNLYYHQIRFWLSKHDYDNKFIYLIGAIIILFTIIMSIRQNIYSKSVMISGISSSGLSFIILFAYQFQEGIIFSMIGILLAAFMAGLTIGVFLAEKILQASKKKLALLHFLFFILIFLPVLLLHITNICNISLLLSNVLWSFLTLILATIPGAIFKTANMLKVNEISGSATNLYAIEMIGSALGAFFIVIILIPVIGVVGTILIIGITNLFLSAYLTQKMQ